MQNKERVGTIGLHDYTGDCGERSALRPEREKPIHKLIILRDRYKDIVNRTERAFIGKYPKYKELFEANGQLIYRYVDTKHLHNLLLLVKLNIDISRKKSDVKSENGFVMIKSNRKQR